MKVKIRTEGFRMTLWFPTILLFSSLTAKIVSEVLKRKTPSFAVPPSELARLFREVRKSRYRFWHLVLLDVDSEEDGETTRVKITF